MIDPSQNSPTFYGCNAEDPLPCNLEIKNATYCYNYNSSDTYYYGNETGVRSIDFYFKIDNITAITSRYLSVGTITIHLMDPSNYVFHFSLFLRLNFYYLPIQFIID